jgi:Tfp pilus assembly protein PilN
MYPLRLNLLTQEKKEKVFHTAQFKFVQNIFQFILIGISVAAIALLLSEQLLQRYFTNIAQNTVAIGNKYSESTKEITTINNLTKRVSEVQKKYHEITPIILSLTNTIPEGIVLNSLNIDYENRIIKFSGIADTRDNFLNFQNKLNENNNLSDIESPVSDLTKKENISFNINAKIN